MILGIFLKNYKCYQGTTYVPCFSSEEEKFVSYLGDNGVGKSAILEGLNTFFSKKPHWLRNKDAKKGPTECFVAPVFIIERKLIPTSLESYSKDLIKNLRLKEIDKNYLAVCVARREDGICSLFDGKKELSGVNEHREADRMYDVVSSLYQYIYLDAEVDIDEAAKINSEIYEVIIGSSIVTEVEKKFKESDEKVKLVDNLNETLQTLIDEKFTKGLQKIDDDYSYGGFKGSISKLTTNILARVSTEAFLSSRKLKFKGKQLDNLSSGQRRTALLDFIISVLESKASDKKKTLILAIDEPEISLDSSKKMAQFEKLIGIAKTTTSIMFTSHWYGWIVATNLGRSVLISEKDNGREIQIFNNKEFPFKNIPKYEMRMVFDFLMSLGASAEANIGTNYIICEGITDSLFFSASLNDEKFKIIPLGKTRVKKIADIFKDYYWKDSGPGIKNVLFIVDTDPQNKDNFTNEYLKRWSKSDDLKFSLESNNTNFHNRCTVENLLEPDFFLASLKEILVGNELVQDLKVKHKNLSGIDAFGMDSVTLLNFEKLLKQPTIKTQIAEKYKNLLLNSGKSTNLIKNLIENSFN